MSEEREQYTPSAQTDAATEPGSLVTELRAKAQQADEALATYTTRSYYAGQMRGIKEAYLYAAELATRYETRWQSDRRALENLLAVIFRDGGQRAASYNGLTVAAEQAENVVLAERDCVAEVQAVSDALGAKLQAIGDALGVVAGESRILDVIQADRERADRAKTQLAQLMVKLHGYAGELKNEVDNCDSSVVSSAVATSKLVIARRIITLLAETSTGGETYYDPRMNSEGI